MVAGLEINSVRKAAVPISIEQYHRLGEEGIIKENTELLFGVIIEKASKSPLHTWVVEYLVDHFRKCLAPDCLVRQEQPLSLSDSEPEPDLAVVRGQRDSFRAQHPSTAEIVVEVAISSRDLDLEKAKVYASANISEYWLIEPQEERLTLFSNPKASKYGRSEVFGGKDQVRSSTLNLKEISLEELFRK